MRDPQTVPATTFDHFWLFFFFFFFFLGWLFFSFFFFFLSFFFLGWLFVVFFLGWLFVVFFFTVRSSILVFIFYFFYFNFLIASVSLGTEKKKMHRLTGMGPQIVWKILSNGNWVMMPNGCEKLSDEWWVIEIEWWKLSDEKNEAKQPLSILQLQVSVMGFGLETYWRTYV